MRTKHIFGTFMLAALAAACTNEELELVNNSTESNELANNRIEIGQIELSLGNEADSRYAVGPNFNDLTPEEGDQVGAALIDNWAPTWDGTNGKYVDHSKDVKYDYTITEFIQTNYSFKFNGETWASEAKMVEGNYFFYAPYNAKHATRSSITARLNPVQNLELNEDGTIDALSAIKQLEESGEVMAVAHKFISREDGKTVSANLRPIYAYPLFTLTNSYKETPAGATKAVATDVIVDQIVIKSDDGFVTAAEFNFGSGYGVDTSNPADGSIDEWRSSTIDNINVEASGVVKELGDFTYWKNNSNPSVAYKGSFVKNNGSEANYTADLMNGSKEISSAIVVKAPADYTLKAGKDMEFYTVLPAANYGTLTIDVYTDKGVFTTNMDLSVAAGKRYAQDEYKTDGTLKNDAEEPAGYVLSFNMEEASEVVDDHIVTSAADMVALIQDHVIEKEAGEVIALNVHPLNEDVEITTAVMNAIKAKKSGFKINFTAPVTIATNLNSTNKYISFEEGAIVKSGEITINSGVKFAGDSEASTLTVKGGTVDVAADFETYSALVVSGGSVNLSSEVAATVSSGTLTIVDDANATGAIENNGGTVTFKAGTKDVVTYSYSNQVTNNKGTLTVPAYTILANVISNGEYTSESDYKAGKIEVKANARVETIGSNAKYSTINVDGIVGASSATTYTDGVTVNNGSIVMGSGSRATVQDNTNGRIDNTKNAKVNIGAAGLSESAKDGVVYYEIKENITKLVAKSSIFNTIVLNGITWSPEVSQDVNANLELCSATIEIWDAAAVITVNGKLYAKNLNSWTPSTITGVDGGKIYYTSYVGTGINVTGVTVAQKP